MGTIVLQTPEDKEWERAARISLIIIQAMVFMLAAVDLLWVLALDAPLQCGQ